VLNTEIPVDFDDLVDGAEQIDDALLRMSALALCARFVYVEDADELWANLVALGRQSGILIPSTLGWLTATAIGSSEAPVLEWYRECIMSYPERVQTLCRRFLDSPVSPKIIPLS
jgi:hypothetical protein